MLTQFGYANWVGNPDQAALRRSAALEKVNRIALQIEHFKPAITVPFASFVYFSHPENAYQNEGQNSPRAICQASRLEPVAHTIRFLRPGSTVDLDSDTVASLALEHDSAVAHWSGLLESGVRLLPGQPPAGLADVEAAFVKYRDTVSASLQGLPRLLEFTRRIVPLAIQLADLGQTVQFSYRSGFSVLGPTAPFHISMTSSNAVFLFKNEYGFDTTQVNGRFHSAHAEALAVFSRFFLPQRMGKNGYDRRHPGVMLRYLLRSVAGRATRVLRSLSSPA
jgi:hypothetical protein